MAYHVALVVGYLRFTIYDVENSRAGRGEDFMGTRVGDTALRARIPRNRHIKNILDNEGEIGYKGAHNLLFI